MNKAARTFVSKWVPVIAWMLLIFAGSTDVLSAEHTSRFIVPFLLWFDPHMSYPTLVRLHILVRKMGHVTEYAILALLLWRALRDGWSAKMWGMAGIALGIAAVYAAFDEFHQSFTPSRTASPNDVLIDVCGALLALLVCLVVARRRSRARVLA